MRITTPHGIERSFTSTTTTPGGGSFLCLPKPSDHLWPVAIIALAHALELCVVAEGVERREQLVELIGLDCEEAQGYLISRPVDVATATEMVVTRGVADVVGAAPTV